jgi:hypothetical protein
MSVAPRTVADGLAPAFTQHPIFWLVLIHGPTSGAGWVNAARAGPGLPPVLAAGQITGLVPASCGLFQIVLASRAPWLERAYGLDGLTRLHHRVGSCSSCPCLPTRCW